MPFTTIPEGQYGLPNINFYSYTNRRKSETVKTVKEIKSEIHDLYTDLNPIDEVINTRQLIFSFENGTARVRKNKPLHDYLQLTEHALFQLGNLLVRSRKESPFRVGRFLHGHKEYDLIDGLWNQYIQSCSDREIMMRTKRVGNQRIITSFQGKEYAVVPDTQLFDAIRPEHQLFNVNVAQVNVLNSHFRFFAPVESKTTPTPSITINNSGAGQRYLQLYFLLYVQICTNGMMGWRDEIVVNERHYGSVEPKIEKFYHEMQNLDNRMRPLLEFYYKTRELQLRKDLVDFDYMEEPVKGFFKSFKNVDHSLIASTPESLAAFWDQSTLAAQQYNFAEREIIEAWATKKVRELVDELS